MKRSSVGLASTSQFENQAPVFVGPSSPTTRVASGRTERFGHDQGRSVGKWISGGLRISVIAAIGLFVQPSMVVADTIPVDCSGVVEDDLQAKIGNAAVGDTVEIKGICEQDVTG